MEELRRGDAIARVDPADGGRIVSLVVGGVERILAKERARPSTLPTSWGCYPMVPWAGRLGDGRIPTATGEVRLATNRPRAAIHGLGFDKAWTVTRTDDAMVEMTVELRGLGWPFGGEARQLLRLEADALGLELEVGTYSRPGPAGLGWHPWFARPTAGDMAVRVDARHVLVLDADLVPTGEVREVVAHEDLRSGPVLGQRRLDHVYVHAAGPAIVRWPDLEMAIELDTPLGTVVVHTPPEGVCVEPQTMWPNAPLLASLGVPDTGIRTLDPGERLGARTRWAWRRLG